MSQMELVLKSVSLELPQSIENLEQLKAELVPKLEKYNNLVVTEDSIKAAKDDKAALNKFKKAIEEERISIKKQYLEPYNVLEAQCKEIVKLIDAPIQAIDTQIKAFDEIEKQEKYTALAEAFEELKAPEWIRITDVLNPKWENKTQKLDSLNSEMAENVQNLLADLDKLSEMYGESEIYLPVVNRYKQSKDFAQTALYAVQLENEYKKEQECKAKEAEEKAQIVQEEPAVEEAITMPSQEQGPPVVQTEEPEMLLKGKFAVECTKVQLIALRNFMKAQGIKFEIIK